jgi:NADH-quinone oxidoreductase subunit J
MIHIPDFANATLVQIIFCILSVITLATAFLTIYSRNPIHSAIYLVISFFSIAGHYLLLNAQFLAIVHVIVYSGAIMILFLFTVMLMNLNKENEVHKPRVTRLGAIVLFCVMCFVLIAIFINSKPIPDGSYEVTGEDFQSIKVLGKVLLNEYMVPFEFASVLLLVAMIGAVLLSKKEKTKN